MTKDSKDQIHSASEMLALAETETNRGAAIQLIVSARKCLHRAMKDDTDTEGKIEALGNALARQQVLAWDVAQGMRAYLEVAEWNGAISAWADLLDPREPLAEADAAERFSKDCAERRTK